MSTNSKQAEASAKKEDSQAGQRFVYQDDELIEKPFDWGQLKRLFSYMKPYKKQMLPIIIIMMLVGAITKLTIPLLIREAIDNSIIPKDKNLLFTYRWDHACRICHSMVSQYIPY